MLAAAVAGAFWRWGLELALLVAVALSWWLLDGWLGEFAASFVMAWVVAAVVATPLLRRVLMRSLRSASVRRRWRLAWIDVDFRGWRHGVCAGCPRARSCVSVVRAA